EEGDGRDTRRGKRWHLPCSVVALEWGVRYPDPPARRVAARRCSTGLGGAAEVVGRWGTYGDNDRAGVGARGRRRPTARGGARRRRDQPSGESLLESADRAAGGGGAAARRGRTGRQRRADRPDRQVHRALARRQVRGGPPGLPRPHLVGQ